MTATQIRISSGRLVDLNDFKPEDVCPMSIERSLNQIKRFTGHYNFHEPLTVAQHTLLVRAISRVLYGKGEFIDLGARIHDFPEAYYGDLSSPLKKHFGDFYREKIKLIDDVVINHFWPENSSYYDYYDVDTGELHNWYKTFQDVEHQVKMADTISLRIEQSMMWGSVPPEPEIIQFFEQQDTRAMFLECFETKHVKLV